MSTRTKIDALFPAISLKTVSGNELVLGQPPQNYWQMMVIYRGLHCHFILLVWSDSLSSRNGWISNLSTLSCSWLRNC